MSRSIDWICLTAEDYSINVGMIHMRCVHCVRYVDLLEGMGGISPGGCWQGGRM